ncbi:tetratricopeptide repeat-containing sensor histidine kinase [Lacihabitans sp. CCS-44]|uniref:tetratricopeptide repeat-containing sensor histidine kinase n=1 Tax=Lacihabitans sp. CCS-44 TaxID=2487331 RepID=UPI0020CF6F18|nr:tetratricopeptide repeat protein [Lacihabitans sp. CCS-44]MCP9756632.1 tetratricopeptide repeat-containing sensor histidine kinase [Lacihabitans sp. CCS-44]
MRIFLIFLTLFSGSIYAQNKTTLDSLNTEYRNLKDPKRKVEVLQKMGQYYYDIQKIDSAISITKESLVLARRINDPVGEFESSISLGNWLLIKSDFPKSKFYLTRALEISKNNKEKNLEMRALKTLGLFYHESGNFKESLKYYEEAIVLAKAENDEDYLYWIYVGIANSHIALEDYKKAQLMYFKAAEYQKKQKNYDTYASHLATAANLYRRLNNIDAAEKPLLEAYAISKKYKDDWTLIDVSRFLGMFYTDKYEFEKANQYLNESLRLSKAHHDNSSILKVFYTLEKLHYVKKDLKNGDMYQKLIIKMRDSLYTAENNKLLAEFDVKYQTADKEAKLKAAQLEIAQHRNLIIGLSLGILGILVSGGLLWRISSIKTKATETEKLKNIEIENQKKLLSAKEIERQRIAKELHDSVGSQLTVVSTSLDNAFYLFENQKLKPEKLENISGEVRLAAQSLRDTIWATYNSEISVADLRSRIQEFVKKFSDENSFNVEINIKGEEVVLTPIEGLNLFRIVQEALNNTQKYASASLVKMDGNFEKDNYNLQISDNGLGFDLNKANTGNSYGLGNMKSRAEEIGGELSVSSSSEGTVVEFSKRA